MFSKIKTKVKRKHLAGKSNSKTPKARRSRSKSRSKSVKRSKSARRKSTNTTTKSRSKSQPKKRSSSKKQTSHLRIRNSSPMSKTPATPLQKILRTSMCETRPSMESQHKRVQICSRRLQDISNLSSSSESSEDSLDRGSYMRAHNVSSWQRACIRKTLPRYLR